MRPIYYVLMLLTSLFWGGNFVAGKFVSHHAGVLTLTDLRYVISSLILLPIVWVKELKFLPPRQAWFPLIGMAVTGVVLFNLLMFLALERTSAYNTGLLSALNPLAIAVVAFFVFRDRLTTRQVLSLFVSLAGVAVVISQGDIANLLKIQFNLGDIYMMLAVLSWGFYSACGKKAMKHVTPLMSTLWMGIIGAVMLLPFDLPTVEFHDAGTGFWLAMMYFGVCGTVLAMLFWNIGVLRIGGTQAGIFLNFNPIFTALLAFLFLGETISFVQIAGTAIVITGVYLFTTAKRPLPATIPSSDAS